MKSLRYSRTDSMQRPHFRNLYRVNIQVSHVRHTNVTSVFGKRL